MASAPGDDNASDETAPLRGSGATEQFAATVTRGGGGGGGGPALHTGDQIGRFILLEQIGAGGMGVVYAARDTDLERRVAIKVLRTRRGEAPIGAMRARLLREAQAAARLSHRNVVTVYEVGAIEDGPASGQVFVAMELIDGETLTRWQGRPRPWRDIVLVYAQAARGLAAAHAAGLVHRDFKPDNALIGKDGEVRVTDFGLASMTGHNEVSGDGVATPVSALSPPSSPSERLTSTGDIMGTPLYMAPEQRRGRAVDARADQYAFCVALFRALHGVYPFGVGSEDALARRAEAYQLETPAGGRVPRVVQRVIARGLRPDAGARWPDMAALIEALERALGSRRRRVIRAAAVVAAAVAAAVAVVALRAGVGAGPTCTSGDGEVAAVWNRDRRAAVAAAFTASGLPGAGDSWRRVEGAVDAWTRDWLTAHVDACRAARVDRRESEAVLARRDACLAGQLDVLDGVLALWAKADRETVARAAESALRLPRIADCATPPALPPGGREAGAAALRATLAELTAAAIGGRFADALPRARQALTDTRALGDRGLEAEAGLLLGRLERQAGADSARSTLFDAAAACEAAGRDGLAVEAWSEWIYVAAAAGVADAELEAASRRAEAALRRAGEDRRLLALLRNNQGNWAYETRRDGDAVRLFDEALALRQELYGADDPRVADILDNLGNAWAGMAGSASSDTARDEARRRSIEYAQRGLDIRLRALGEDSAATARSLHNVASALEAVDRLDDADRFFRRSLAAKERVLGPDHPGLGTTLVLLGRLAERRGNLDEALAHFQRGARLWDRPEGAGVGPLCTPLGHSIDVLMALGRPADAIAAADRCAAVQADDPLKSRSRRREAALARLEAGQVEAALGELRELVAADAEAYAVDDPRRARGLVALARAQRAAGQARAAAATIDRAARLVAASVDASPGLRAEVAITRAEIDHALGRRAAAAATAALALCPGEACGVAVYGLRRRAAALAPR